MAELRSPATRVAYRSSYGSRLVARDIGSQHYDWRRLNMDLLIAISQGLGLAVAAGFLAAAPLALGSTAARLGFAHSALGFASDPITLAVTWALAIIEIITDVIWPGAFRPARCWSAGSSAAGSRSS